MTLSARVTSRVPLAVAQPRPARVPLSFAQRRLWFLDQLQGGSAEYNLIEAAHVYGPLDCAALRRAVATVVARHEALRTRFAIEDGEPFQVIAPAITVSWIEERLDGLDASTQAARVETALRYEIETPFDLATGPLLRVRIVRLGPEDHVVLRTIHHIVSDGWSQSLFNGELNALYEAERRGRPDPLPPLPVQYADFTLWQRESLTDAALEAGLAYWTRQLAGLSDRSGLPTDRLRPARPTFEASAVELPLRPELTAKLRAVARTHQATMYMMLLTALAILLARYSGDDDVGVGTAIANRRDPRLEQLIGFFLNTLVMRVRIGAGDTLSRLLAHVRATALEAYHYRDAPFERVVESLMPARTLSGSPFVEVMLVLQNTPLLHQSFTGTTVERIRSQAQHVRFDLELYGWERPDRVVLAWLYKDRLFDRWRIEQMARHYTCILEALAADPGQPIEAVTLVTSAERETVIAAGTVALNPDVRHAVPTLAMGPQHEASIATAIDGSLRSVTYRELRKQRRRIAHAIRALTSPGDLVGIVTGDPLTMAIAVGGAVDGGAGFVPLDPALPEERLRLMVSSCTPRVLLADEPSLPRVRGWSDAGVLPLARCLADPTADDEELPEIDWRGRVAYVYFTSGSTGVPKAVAGRMAGLEHFIRWEIDTLGLGTDVRVSQLTHPGFDPYLRDLFVAWAAGGTLCIPPDRNVMLDPARLVRWLAEARVTLMHTVPSVLRLMLAEPDLGAALPRLRYVLSAGEPLLAADVRRWTRVMGPDVRLVNVYGPTETTLAKFAHRVVAEDAERSVVPVGRPLPGTTALVLDRQGRVNPFGVAGEVAIATPYRSWGYHRAPALTAEAFVANPYGSPGDVLYRTGDLGRALPDGTFECLGRRDRQIKIRGQRVELGEIEIAVLEHPGVRQVAVLAWRASEGDYSLAAYVVGEGNPREWRAAAQRRLPAAMVPTTWIRLEQLPLTPHGKVDWRALPRPDAVATESSAEREPAGSEDLLCALFADVIGVPVVVPEDDFFALGGHSLMAARLVGRIRAACGAELSLQDLFEAPQVFAIAERVAARAGAASGIVSLRPGGTLPSLVCVVSGDSSALPYATLLQSLGPEHPVYLVDADVIAGAHAPQETIAAECRTHIRALQPSGPYQVFGWRAAGAVAHEAARALQQDGAQIGLLALFDADLPRDAGIVDGDLLLFVSADPTTDAAAAWRPFVAGQIHVRHVTGSSDAAIWRACVSAIGSILAPAVPSTV